MTTRMAGALKYPKTEEIHDVKLEEYQFEPKRRTSEREPCDEEGDTDILLDPGLSDTKGSDSPSTPESR